MENSNQFYFFLYRYRVVLLGDSGVGKTALVSQFMTSEYMHTYDASLGESKGIIIFFCCWFALAFKIQIFTLQ